MWNKKLVLMLRGMLLFAAQGVCALEQAVDGYHCAATDSGFNEGSLWKATDNYCASGSAVCLQKQKVCGRKGCWNECVKYESAFCDAYGGAASPDSWTDSAPVGNPCYNYASCICNK